MPAQNFHVMLEKKWSEGKFVCVGLDSEFSQLPNHLRDERDVVGSIVSFNEILISALQDLALGFKMNLAPYLKLGSKGLEALRITFELVRRLAPDSPAILDGKFGDVYDSNLNYASFSFSWLGADAVTVNGYVGREALQPFLLEQDKGVIVLCHTSNRGAGEFQELPVQLESGHTAPLYQVVAERVARSWNNEGNCGLVAGATYPEAVAGVREAAHELVLLEPGFGFQQTGSLKEQLGAVLPRSFNARGRGVIVGLSRGIIFSSHDENFAQAARREVLELNKLIQEHLN